MNIDDKQREKLMTIISLGKAFGGSKEVDSFLMNEAMKTLMPPETDKIDELASIGSVLESVGGPDTEIGKQIMNEYYTQQGIDPVQKAKEDALMQTFQGEFPTQDVNSQDALTNASIMAQAQANPALVSQYYQQQPDLNWLQKLFGADSKKKKAERFNSLAEQYTAQGQNK